MEERLEYYDQMNVERLVFEKRKTEAIIESLEDVFVLIDAQGVIAHINEVGAIILGARTDRGGAGADRSRCAGQRHPLPLRLLSAARTSVRRRWEIL
jgi:hypothetical protein